VARLLEHEGIYWYVRATTSRGTRSCSWTTPARMRRPPSCRTLDYYEAGDQAPPDTPCVQAWSFAQAVASGAVALTSFDFERPSAKLDVLKQHSRSHAQSAHELFDYANEYIVKDDGSQYAVNRIDEAQTGFETMQGDSNAQGLETGRLFTLARHPRADQNARVPRHRADAARDARRLRIRPRCRHRVAQLVHRDSSQAAISPRRVSRASPSCGGRRRPSSPARPAPRSTPTSTAA
jgi:uncharacterized protein involved in type VI secretion and phage assembly